MAIEQTLKEKVTEWDVYTDRIAKTTPVDIDETPEAQQERIAMLEADPEKWFNYYFPLFSFAEPTEFHKEATNRILNNHEWYEVRMWSRELAKSTRTMFEVLYLTLVANRQEKAASSGHQDTKQPKSGQETAT